MFLTDRNFLGYELITAILDVGGHLIMRVRDGISLPLTENGWLPDGSRLTYLNEPERRRACDRLSLRVAEHNVVLPGSDGEVAETLHHRVHAAGPPDGGRRDTPPGIYDALDRVGDHDRENKTTVTGAGPATTPCLRSGEPDLVCQELWAWLAATQLVRASAAAALGTRVADAAAARRSDEACRTCADSAGATYA